MNNNTAITITYSNDCLRTLVEEFITMQKHEFTFKDLCSYVLYWAKEECKTSTSGFYESNQLDAADCERISNILNKIIKEGRLSLLTPCQHLAKSLPTPCEKTN
ncbi:MAG: hypothetical protein J6X88_01195 [Bacteroidales bacterium]|nr:hypothetical protein [Bacteroidales bacterium]